jgi:ATP phosphoribosyltransferase
MTRLKLAIQKSGRLSEDSLALLERSGLKFARSKDKLFWYGENLPIDLMLVRDDDIPRFLMAGVCQLGIVGGNVALEKGLERSANPGRGSAAPEEQAALKPLLPLGFGRCRLMLAAPEGGAIRQAKDLEGKRVATSYPALTQQFFEAQGIQAQVVFLSGAVEIAPALGSADAIVDLVSTGTTLRANHLEVIGEVLSSQANLYRCPQALPAEAERLIDTLFTRIEGVLRAAEAKYVMMHAPKAKLPEITALLPGAETPTILSLEGDPDRVALHAMCTEQVFWEHLEELKRAGASAILVLPVEKMLA